MSWTALDETLLEPLIRFLGPLEASCVSFSEHLVSGRRLRVPRGTTQTVHVRVRRDGTIDGAILQSAAGVFHPVLDVRAPEIEAEAVRRITRVSRRLYSIMGTTEHVEALERAFHKSPREYLTYHLMVQTDPIPEITHSRLPAGLVIRQARANEHRHLFEIQKKYEIEEVLLPGSTFSPNATLQHLKRTLEQQYVLVGEVEGTPIAKANTNARGIFHDQIGGVFTEPDYRSRGIGTALMVRLLEHIGHERKTGTLFVKKENAAAIRMYQSVGFSAIDEFKISYFR